MKNIKYILLLLLSFSLFSSCNDDDGKDPEFGDHEIYMYGDWQEYRAFIKDQPVTIKGLFVSPNEPDLTYAWYLGDKKISDKKDLEYTAKEYLQETLKFVVTRSNGTSATRESNVIVPQPFVPKTKAIQTLAFISEDGRISDIDWESVTHIVYAGLTVTKGGDLKFKDEINSSALIAYAHHYGVFVQMQVTGTLSSNLACTPAYADFSFYNQILADPVTLATRVVKEAKDRNFDGINILMDKANGTTNGWFDDNASQAKFYQAVGQQLKAKKNVIEEKEYPYLTSMTAWSGWTRVSIYAFVKNADFDWINMLAFGNEGERPQEHAGGWFTGNEIDQWMTTWIGPIPANRLVLVTPAFGLQYKGKPADFNWGNLWKYTTYKSYANICASDATAHTKNKLFTVDYTGAADDQKEVDVTYYDGLPAAVSKAALVKSKALHGIGLWSVESDSKDPAKSLMKQMRTTLDAK